MSDMYISGNGKTATVKGFNLEADITPDYCIICLRGQTMRLNPDDLWNMETIVELAKQIHEENLK